MARPRLNITCKVRGCHCLGLHTQLRQVQEERDRAWHWCAATNERSVRVLEDANRLRAERDDARGHWTRAERGWNRVILQAEGFQRDAAEQRALILRIHKVCNHTLEGDRSLGWYKMVVFDIGQLTTPAEAQERKEGKDA